MEVLYGSALSGCKNVTSITLPKNLKEIYNFYSCTSLTTLSMYDSVETIHEGAFSQCGKLSRVNYSGTEESFKSINVGSNNGRLNSASVYYNCSLDPMYGVSISYDNFAAINVSAPTAAPAGSIVTIVVTENDGYVFLGWYDQYGELVSDSKEYSTEMTRRGIKLVAKTVECDRWDGTAAEGIASGSGTAEDPYLITTAEELAFLAKMINTSTGYNNKYYKLTRNLDLGGYNWTPIGTYTTETSSSESGNRAFKGTFDGAGYTISNLTINDSQSNKYLYFGLFGVVLGGKIEDLNMDMVNIGVGGGRSDINAGAIAGFIDSKASITRCTVSGSISVIASSYAHSGGLVGKAKGSSSISDCYATVNVSGVGSGSYSYARVGGIVGACYGSLEKCVNNGEIKAFKSSEVGGIAGYCGFGGTISHSGLENTANVTAGEYTAGIIGRLNNSTNAKSNYVLTLSEVKNSGNIVGTAYTAGVVGYLYAINSNYSTKLVSTSIENTGNATGTFYVGGIFGYADSEGDTYVMNSSSSGVITAEYYIGGIAGRLANIAIRDTSNEGTVINVTGVLINDGVYYTYAGGYVGCGSSEITNCHNYSSITVTGKGSRIGGIAGETYANIKNCSNKGNITAENCFYVGGIAGNHNGTGSKTLTKIINEARIVGGDYTGGIFGRLINELGDKTSPVITFSEVTNKGEILGQNYVGGLAGYFRGYNTRGDYAARIDASALVNEGNVSGTGTVGGLMAYCFADNSSSKIVGYISTGTVTGEITSQTVCELSNVTIQE